MNLTDGFWTALAATSAALITGIVTVFTTRPKLKTDVQAALNTGFATLVDDLREERDNLRTQIDAHRKQLFECEGEIRQLRQKIESLQRVIVLHGLQLPMG